MKIFEVQHLAQADKITIEKQGITSEMLMERAATLVFHEIHSRLAGAKGPIKIFCGIGNNGGDGLVLGRLLLEQHYNVSLYVVNYSNARSADFLANYNKLKGSSPTALCLIDGGEDFPELSEADFIVDAIFGIGLNRELEDWVAQLVSYINKSGAFIVSIDMPSGLFADKTPSKKDAVINAKLTLTFQAPKLVFFLPQTAHYVGDYKVLELGLDREYLDKTPVKAVLLDHKEALTLYIPRKRFSHKGNYGHSLIIGGSYGKIGSVSLTATAALRSGAGLVTVFAPKCGIQILQTILPEAMVLTDKAEKELSKIEFEIEPDVICFGMGAGTSRITTIAFKEVLQKTEAPMVIDADGLNILSKEKEFLRLVPQNSVLTPHPRELERLLGKWKDDFQKLEKTRIFSKKHKVIVVIKGAHTITVSGDKLFVNNTGNPGMATAGSGDVLSGVITGLISQGYPPLKAAVFGVYLHGRAGDIAAEKLSAQGMISGDIAKNIGAAFLDLFKKAQEK